MNQKLLAKRLVTLCETGDDDTRLLQLVEVFHHHDSSFPVSVESAWIENEEAGGSEEFLIVKTKSGEIFKAVRRVEPIDFQDLNPKLKGRGRHTAVSIERKLRLAIRDHIEPWIESLDSPPAENHKEISEAVLDAAKLPAKERADAIMRQMVDETPSAVEWSLAEWSTRLNASKKTVAKTDCWQWIMEQRAEGKAIQKSRAVS